jgi:DNA-binding response OmpR family regulator
MIGVTILAVTDNPSWLEFFWDEARSVQGTRLVVTGSMEEACDLLRQADARLIVVDWQDATVSSEQMDQLLWANSILAHPATVLVVEHSYRGDHASSLFQMGVDDYIGLSEHSDRLRMILARMLARTMTHKIRSSQLVSQAPRPVLDPLPRPARLAVAASSA